MRTQLSKAEVLRMLNKRFTGSLIKDQEDSPNSKTPTELLGRYVAAVVADLYGDNSDDAANRERIAHGLEVGSEDARGLAAHGLQHSGCCLVATVVSMSDLNRYLLAAAVGILAGGVIGALFGEAGLGLALGGPVGLVIALLRSQGREGR